MNNKVCSKCNTMKDFSEFSPRKDRGTLASWCKKCCASHVAKKYRDNPAVRANCKANLIKWRSNNREHVRKRNREYVVRRYASDLNFNLAIKLRSRFQSALKTNEKSGRTLELIGCSLLELRLHLEKQFLPGMAWSNFGKWHIDHIRPCVKFDLSDPAQQKVCFHFSNLQPLWAADNIRKGAR